MNDRARPPPAESAAAAGPLPDLALPIGMRLGTFEILRVMSRSASAIVYLAADDALAMQVAIQEYLPVRLMQRDAGLRLIASAAWHDDTIARGLRAFVDEARMLARAEHPSLVRVHQLFHANGSAYRVMPVYTGQRLSDLRRKLVTAPDEAALRSLIDGLLGALETIHQSGQVHGGLTPENILLLADDRPLLLGAGATAHEIGSDLVESLMATLESPASAERSAEAGAPPTGAVRDLYTLAGVIRFCITAEPPPSPEASRPHEPLANAVARNLPLNVRQPYSAALLDTLDAALSPFAQERPRNVAEFRGWLARGVPGGAMRDAGGTAASVEAAPAPTPAPAAPPAFPEALMTPPVAAAPSPASPFSFDDAFPPRLDGPMAAWPDVVRATEPPFSAPPPKASTPAPAPPSPSPSPSPSSTRTRQRHYKWLLGSSLSVLAAAVLAVATGAWNLAPEITLGPDAKRLSVPVPRAALDPQPPIAQALAPQAAARPEAAAPTEPIAASTSIDPTRPLDTDPTAAGPAPQPRAARAAAASPSTTTGSAATGASPRAACAGRTEFALYRCMLQQCQVKRWAVHPQCVRLRLDDRVD